MIIATGSNEIIEAIGALWKLVFSVALLLAVILFRKSIHHAIMKLRGLNFKKGGTELSIDTGGEEASTEAPPADEKKQEPVEPIVEEEPTPKESGALFAQMYGAFKDGEFEAADQAFERLQETEEEPATRRRNEVIRHWLMYIHGQDPKAVQKLERLAEKPDYRATALYWVAKCHEHSRSYAKAEAAYSLALSEELSESDRARHSVGLAKCRVAMDKTQEGLDALSAALALLSEPEAKAETYRAIADIHEKAGNSTLRAIALQKVLEFAPADTSSLFSAAYAQGEAKFPCLAVTNYSTLLRFDAKNYVGLNNLGVECENLEMPIKSVGYYERAVDGDNTLAMSNIAYRYMKQGFQNQAQDLLDRARKDEAPHRNVGEAMAALEDKKQKESEALEQIMGEGNKQKEFFWAYADAYFMPADRDCPFAGSWTAPNGNVFSISQEEGKIKAKWETEENGERFVGTVHNRAATVKYKKKTGLGRLLMPSWGSAQEGFVYISDDLSRIYLHTCEKRTTFFLELKKQTEQDPPPESNTTSD